jgi:putative transposase
MSTKRRKRHSPEQIVRKLRDADAMLNAGKDLAAVLQALEISESSYDRWRNQYGAREGRGSGATEEAGGREPAAQGAGGREGAGYQGPQAECRGKLVSPARKREAVTKLRTQLAMSERRACRVLDQPRSSQRRKSPKDDEAGLVKRMLELVREHPRFGYRRIGVLLRAEGYRAGATRMLRLWRQEGLKVPQKKRKRRRLGTSDNGLVHRRAEAKDHVWTWKSVFDRTTAGSPLKWLSIVDEYTRECLALKADRSITSEDVIDTLAELLAMRGVPQCIRSDNGPEFIAHAVRQWLGQVGVETLYVEPGSPWENGYVESFHSRLRDESSAFASLLNLEWHEPECCSANHGCTSNTSVSLPVCDTRQPTLHVDVISAR